MCDVSHHIIENHVADISIWLLPSTCVAPHGWLAILTLACCHLLQPSRHATAGVSRRYNPCGSSGCPPPPVGCGVEGISAPSSRHQAQRVNSQWRSRMVDIGFWFLFFFGEGGGRPPGVSHRAATPPSATKVVWGGSFFGWIRCSPHRWGVLRRVAMSSA
jgi:hypothetical protein